MAKHPYGQFIGAKKRLIHYEERALARAKSRGDKQGVAHAEKEIKRAQASINAMQKGSRVTTTQAAPTRKSGPGPFGTSAKQAAKMRAQAAAVKPAATKGSAGSRAGGKGGGGLDAGLKAYWGV